MTSTRAWLEARRAELRRLDRSAGLLATAGGVLLILGTGVLFARNGFYLRAPWLLVPLATIGLGAWWYRIRSRRLESQRLAQDVESNAGLRRGSIVGVAGEEPM